MVMVILFILFVIFIALLGFFLQTSKTDKKLEKANNLYKFEKYKEALELFQELYSKQSGNKLYNWYIGQCYEKLKNYELALVEYNKASLSTKFIPPLNEAEVHKRIALANLELGNVNRAYREFQIVTTLNPQNPDAYFYLGVMAKNKGELQKGVEFFEKAFQNKKDYPEAYFEHGKLNYLLMHTDKAKKSLLEAINQDPDLYEAHYYYGIILEKDKVYQKSIDEFLLAQRDDRFKFDSYVHLGSIYMALSDKDSAFDIFEKALAVGTVNKESLLDAKYKYADYLVQERDLNRALKLWQEIYSQDDRYKDVESKIQIYGDISKSENLTRFFTSLKQDFIKTGYTLCKLLRVKVENYNFQKNDLLEFIGTSRLGRDDIICVMHMVRWTSLVGEIPVRELIDSVVERGASKGIFVTATYFSEKAHDLSKIRPLELIEREKLERLLSKVYE